MEICARQFPRTTPRPPASRALRMGPPTGSFSRRSLTSWVGKERICTAGGTVPACLPVWATGGGGGGGEVGGGSAQKLTWKNCSCFSGLQKKGCARTSAATGRPRGSLRIMASINCRLTTLSGGGGSQQMQKEVSGAHLHPLSLSLWPTDCFRLTRTEQGLCPGAPLRPTEFHSSCKLSPDNVCVGTKAATLNKNV